MILRAVPGKRGKMRQGVQSQTQKAEVNTNTQVLVALIGAGGAIVAAVIGTAAALSRRAKPGPAASTHAALKSVGAKAPVLTFVDVSLVPGSNWQEGPQHWWPVETALDQAERSARWYFRRPRQIEDSDLPLEATVINNGTNPVIISRVGVEVVANMNVWYSGQYYGQAPRAKAVDIAGAYELSLPASAKIKASMNADPDDDLTWFDIGETYGVPLADPMYLEHGVPFRYTLNLKHYDRGMATHTILRLWLRSSVGEIRSDEISVIFGR